MALKRMSKRRFLVADLFTDYAAHKAREEWHSEWGVALLYRPLAILMASPLLRLGIPATAVTCLSLTLTPLLPLLAIAAGPDGFLAVGLVAILILTLDCVDGTMARASGTVSRFGHYLDFMTDVVTRGALYAAIGLMAEGAAPGWLEGRALPLALLAALLAIAARLCRVYGEPFVGEAYGRQEQQQGKRSFLGLAFSLVSGIDQLLPLAVIGLGAIGHLGWLVLWLVAYSALDFVYTQFAILRRL
jgi:phosphatidylglycerophosphate synthase